MQETKIRTPAKDLPPPRSGWIRLVAMLGVGALLIGTLYGIWQTVASSDDPGQTVPREPDFSLTDEQAIAHFEQLHTTLVDAIQAQDDSLLPAVATSQGPILRSSIQEIADLRKNGVRDHAEISIRDASVISNRPDEVALEVVLEVLPCFLDEDGRDITKGPDAIEQQLTWTLRVERDRWLIHNGVLQSDRVIPGDNEDC
jgi:hypothetical protein